MDLSPLYQVLICGTHVLSHLCQFWTRLQDKLAHKRHYQVSVRGLRLRLPELQAEDYRAWKVGEQGLKDGWEENVDGVLSH